MAGWPDLVNEAQPCLAEIQWRVTEGRTWRLELSITDTTGAPVAMTTLGITGTATVYNQQQGGTALADPLLTVAVADTLPNVTISADDANTIGLAPLTGGWGCVLTNPTTSETVQVCRPGESAFLIGSDN